MIVATGTEDMSEWEDRVVQLLKDILISDNDIRIIKGEALDLLITYNKNIPTPDVEQDGDVVELRATTPTSPGRGSYPIIAEVTRDAYNEIITLINEDKKIEAIKALRAATNCGLFEAKTLVEQLIDQLRE